MVRTPAETSLRVRRNLLRDRNRLAHRERRARKKTETVLVPMTEFIGRNAVMSADQVGARAALLKAQETARQAQAAAVKAEQQAQPDAARAVL